MPVELRDRTYFHEGRRLNATELLTLLNNDKTLRVLKLPKGLDVTDATRKALLGKVWTQDEVDLLRTHFRSVPLKELIATHLPNKTGGQVRHMASTLGLTEERDVWSAEEERALTLLRKSRVSFSDIATILKRSRRACEVRAHHLGTTFPQPIATTGDADGDRGQYASLGSQAKGRLAEVLAASQLVLNGVDVFEPFFPQHTVDLVGMRDNKFFKLQVKSAVWIPATARFRIGLNRKNPRTHERTPYKETDVDFFLAVCLGVNAVYVIPKKETIGVAEINLYPHRETGGNQRGAGDGAGWERFRNGFSLIR